MLPQQGKEVSWCVGERKKGRVWRVREEGRVRVWGKGTPVGGERGKRLGFW